MPASKPMTPRPSGGFNQGFGDFGEHLDETAVQQAMQQKAASQQATNPQTAQVSGQNSTAPTKPREIGTIKEELVTRPAHDILKGLVSLFDIKSILGLNPQTDTPEEQAKKKQLHQRFNQLTQEQQQVAQENYKREMERKRRIEEEKQAQRQREEQAKAQSIAPPSSPSKGPAGAKKPAAVDKLEQDRKTLSGPQSVG